MQTKENCMKIKSLLNLNINLNGKAKKNSNIEFFELNYFIWTLNYKTELFYRHFSNSLTKVSKQLFKEHLFLQKTFLWMLLSFGSCFYISIGECLKVKTVYCWSKTYWQRKVWRGKYLKKSDRISLFVFFHSYFFFVSFF